MDKETILSYLETIRSELFQGEIVPAYKQVEFIIENIKADIKYEKKFALVPDEVN